MKSTFYWTFIISALIVLHACSSGNTNETEILSIKDVTETSVILNETRKEAAQLVSGTIPKKHVEIWSEATGIVGLPPDEISSIYPRHEGYITKVNVLAGSKVKKGMVLGYYEHPHLLDMQLAYLKAKEQLSYFDSVLHREQILGKEKAVPLKSIQLTLTERNKANLETSAMGEKLRIIGIDPASLSAQNLVSSLPMKSSTKGFVEAVNIHQGMYVTPETLCFKVYGNEHKHIELTVFREQLEDIREGQKVLFSMAGSDDVFEGEIFLVNPIIDPNSTTATVHVHFDDKKIYLTTGSRINARISVLQDSAYVLPKDEVIRVGKQYRIFTKNDNSYYPTWINIGREGYDWIEITGPESIFESEIVLQGNYYLQGSL